MPETHKISCPCCHGGGGPGGLPGSDSSSSSSDSITSDSNSDSESGGSGTPGSDSTSDTSVGEPPSTSGVDTSGVSDGGSGTPSTAPPDCSCSITYGGVIVCKYSATCQVTFSVVQPNGGGGTYNYAGTLDYYVCGTWTGTYTFTEKDSSGAITGSSTASGEVTASADGAGMQWVFKTYLGYTTVFALGTCGGASVTNYDGSSAAYSVVGNSC